MEDVHRGRQERMRLLIGTNGDRNKENDIGEKF